MTAAIPSQVQSELLPPSDQQMFPPVRQAGDDGLTLTKLWLIVQRRSGWFVVTFALCLSIAGLITLREWLFSPNYRGGFRMLVQDPLADNKKSTNSLDELARLEDNSVDTPNLIEVLQSPMLLDPLASKLKLNYGALNNKVQISVGRDTDVLNVNLLWRNPSQGKLIIDALAKEYLEYSLRQRQEKLKQGLQFLDDQAPGLETRVAQLQQELAAFRRKYTLLSPDEQSARLEAQRSDLLAQRRSLDQTQATLAGIRAMVAAGQLTAPFQAVETDTAASGNASGANTTVNQIKSEFSPLLASLTDLESEIATAQATFRDDSPLLRSLIARKNKLRPLLQNRQLQSIDSALNVNSVQRSKLNQQIDSLTNQFRQNPELIKQYEGMQQRLEVARDNLGSYLKTRESFRLEVAQRTVPWQLIYPPQFGAIPVEPDIPRNLLMGVLVGAALGITLAYVRDRFDYVYHTISELEKELGIPVLAGVPYLPESENATINQLYEQLSSANRFELRESLRNFFQSLKTLRASRTLRMIAISSSVPSEGKTTSSCLLGQALSDLGMKVLLVDGDLRRMRLHRFIGIDNTRGWSEMFQETPPKLEDLYQFITPNLAVMPGGPELPDPAQLLSSDRCSEVIQEIRNLTYFDLIIVDTPPALDLVDAQLIASHLDGMILLVSLGNVNRDLPSRVVSKLRASGIDLLGVIANQRVYSTTDPGYGYSYGYSYGYGYGYGYGPDADDQNDDKVASDKPSTISQAQSLLSRLNPKKRSNIPKQ
jgi:succinoglycan biosynthesis transport protein ExoP